MEFKTKLKLAKNVKPGDIIFYNRELYWVDDVTIHYLEDWPNPARRDELNAGIDPKTLIVDFFGEDGDSLGGLPYFHGGEPLDVVIESDKEKIFHSGIFHC